MGTADEAAERREGGEVSNGETIRCNWCSKPRKPSAYAGDCEFPGLVDICQWCRGVETRRNGAKPHGNGPPRADEWVGTVETPAGDETPLNRQQ